MRQYRSRADTIDRYSSKPAAASARASICLSMIVRDEAPVIRRALESALPFIDSYSISDTGSQDDTKKIAAEMLADKYGVLRSDEWQDFATNRNLAMESAPSDWIFILDADEVLCGDLVIPEGTFDGFVMKVRYGSNVEVKSVRVLRNDGKWNWDNVVHEVPHHEGGGTLGTIETAWIEAKGGGHQTVTGNKFERHLELLQASERTPRTVFYLANTLRDLGRIPEAIEVYRERAEMKGFDEEVYYALWQIGLLTDDEAALRTACYYRPARSEARLSLCEFLGRAGRHAERFEVSSFQYVAHDALFVDPAAPWRLIEEHALAAWEIGAKQVSEASFKQLLRCPIDDVRLRTHNNIKFFNDK